MTTKSPITRLRILLILAIFIFSTAITSILKTAGPDYSFTGFKLVHLVLVFACGLVVGALISQFRQYKMAA